MRERHVNIGLLGCGVVGSGLYELIMRNQTLIKQRTGVQLNVVRVLIRDPLKPRVAPAEILTQDPADILEADDIHIVVEVMGGVSPAAAFLERALLSDKQVVTANKTLMSQEGHRLFRLASMRGLRIGIEASICSGVPIIRVLRQALVGSRITTLCGIVNGTTNFMLTRMDEDDMSFEQALALVRAKGFTEKDPAFDLSGADSAQKLVLLSQLAFGARVYVNEVPTDGIYNIHTCDIKAARAWGFKVKHLAVGRRVGQRIDVRVHPALVPISHALASVRDEFNAILLHCDETGELTFQGKGAGPGPTASSLLADIVEVAMAQRSRGHYMAKTERLATLQDIPCRFYIRFPIADRPGIIGLVSTALGRHGISISQATATMNGSNPEAQPGAVTILTHPCLEKALHPAVDEISRFGVLQGPPVTIRIFEGVASVGESV